MGLRPVLVVWSGALRMTTLIEVLVTPGAVAPPLSAFFGQGFTHGIHPWYTNLIRPRSLSHCGPLSAAFVPTPLSRLAAPASPAVNAIATNAVTISPKRRRLRLLASEPAYDILDPRVALHASSVAKAIAPSGGVTVARTIFGVNSRPAWSPQRAERGPHFLDEERRLLEGGEV